MLTGMVDSDDVPDKLCHKCGEWLPATDEFFPKLPNGRLHAPCKACVAERRRKVSAQKPCCVPGCNKPRYHWRFARCWEHRHYAVKGRQQYEERKAAQL